MKGIAPDDEPGVAASRATGRDGSGALRRAAPPRSGRDVREGFNGLREHRGEEEDSGETAEAQEADEGNASPSPEGQEPAHASDKSPIQTISIIGQVEGHVVLPSQSKTTKYEHIIPQLLSIEQDPEVKAVFITLNTVGGDVEAGLAIAEMIASLSKPTVSLVLGGGHSIGVPIAVAATRSFIVPTATMTIHPIRINGYVIGVPQTFEYLDKMQDRVIQFVCDHSRVSERRLRELMFRTGELARDVGTLLVGPSAVKEGLIDEVGGLGPAIAYLRDLVARQEENGGESPPRKRAPRRHQAAKGGMGPRSTPSFQRNKYGNSPSPDPSTP